MPSLIQSYSSSNYKNVLKAFVKFLYSTSVRIKQQKIIIKKDLIYQRICRSLYAFTPSIPLGPGFPGIPFSPSPPRGPLDPCWPLSPCKPLTPGLPGTPSLPLGP